MKKVAKKFCPLMKKRYIRSVFKRIIIMAIAIKTIPVLTGEMAERFVEMAEDSNHKATTVIPANLKNAINRMMERSKNAKIKVPV